MVTVITADFQSRVTEGIVAQRRSATANGGNGGNHHGFISCSCGIRSIPDSLHCCKLQAGVRYFSYL
jgi:hypothetical protein